MNKLYLIVLLCFTASPSQSTEVKQVNVNGTNIYDLYKQQAETHNVHKKKVATTEINIKIEVKK